MTAVVQAASRPEIAVAQARVLSDAEIDFIPVRDLLALDRALHTLSPSALLLDLPLAGLSDNGLTELLRTAPPALVCAAPEVAAEIALPHRFLAQPYTVGEWLAAVRALVAVAPALTFDAATGIVALGEEAAALTPIEARLFDLLWHAEGDVVSVTEIVQGVWGYAPDAAAADLVRAHIYQLRRRLAAIGLPDAIETLPRRGYRLVLPRGGP